MGLCADGPAGVVVSYEDDADHERFLWTHVPDFCECRECLEPVFEKIPEEAYRRDFNVRVSHPEEGEPE